MAHSLSSVVEDAVRTVVAGVLVRVLAAVEKRADLVHPTLAGVALHPRLLLPESTSHHITSHHVTAGE